VLGESGRFLGSSEWYEFSFRVQLPIDCMAQEIRLVSAGTYGFEHKMSGSVWFDALSMHEVFTPQGEAELPNSNQTQSDDEAYPVSPRHSGKLNQFSSPTVISIL